MSTNTDTGKSPAILLSLMPTGTGTEMPLALEGLPTEVKVKVGTEEKTIPVAYFEKDVIECGSYTHPITGQKFTVDQARLEQWANKFNAMRTAGIDIPCPVDHSDKAEDNRGFAIKMRREGNKLRVTQQVFGDDGALLAMRNRCSVQFHPNFKDEHGKSWGDAIEHVAFTPIPVISGQGPFVPIAASRGEQSTPVFYLSASQRSPEMDLSKLRGAIGAGTEVTDEKLLELAATKLGALTQTETDLATAKTKITELETSVTTLSRQANPEPLDPRITKALDEVLEGSAANYEQKLDMAVDKGDMPLSLSKKVKAKLRDTAKKPIAFMLSRQEDIAAKPVDFILDLFEGAKLGVATGTASAIQLNRRVPGDDKEEPMSLERRNKLRADAGLEPLKA